MHIHTLAAIVALAVQQPGAPSTSPQTPSTPPSPIARLVISPALRTVTAGDTLRLRAQAFDTSGAVMPNVTVRFVPTGGVLEGTVDSAGLVSSGATGVIPVAVVAMVPGSRPKVERIEVRMVPGPAARVDVTPKVARLIAGQRLRLAATAYSRAGDERDDAIVWRSSAPRVVRVSSGGELQAVAAGRARVMATADAATNEFEITVLPNTVATMRLEPARLDVRQGDVVRLAVKVADRAGKAVAGLIPSWTLSPGNGVIDPDGAFVAYAPGEYMVTASLGERSADAVVRVAPREVARKATVVGRLPRSEFWTSEVWLHPNGRNAYLGTVLGGDRIYVLDISDPAKPTVVDSIVANARSINDVMATADGKWLVFTRENAADRKNGIVIASLEDPAHPKPVADFTSGVTSGVHSAFVYTQPKFGTHVYLTNDGTGALNVVDITDPYNPKMVGEWRPERAGGGGGGGAGRSLHDVDVQDGLAYVSYWNDGLIILDVGKGIKGGSPGAPKLVSQFKYNLNTMYKDAEARYGPGFIRGTHTAWRHKNYVFIGDEVFPPPSPTGFDLANIRAYGRLQVIDVSDLDHPRSVAWYEPEYGGVHNVWVAGDTLYLGAYNGGFHAFDVSGELRGDLKAQGREIAALNTADMSGKVQNKAFTWGVVVKDGLAYVNDLYNGLWIVRLEPKGGLTP